MHRQTCSVSPLCHIRNMYLALQALSVKTQQISVLLTLIPGVSARQEPCDNSPGALALVSLGPCSHSSQPPEQRAGFTWSQEARAAFFPDQRSVCLCLSTPLLRNSHSIALFHSLLCRKQHQRCPLLPSKSLSEHLPAEHFSISHLIELPKKFESSNFSLFAYMFPSFYAVFSV